MVELFDRLLNKQPDDGLTPEERVDAATRGDLQDLARLEDSGPSQTDSEFKEGLMRPSAIADSKYHALLTKELGTAILMGDEDEFYFSLYLGAINMAESMGLDKVRNNLHARMVGELRLTQSRKGRFLDSLLSQIHELRKSIAELKEKRGGVFNG